MCNIVVLFKDSRSPANIRPLLRGLNPKFLQADCVTTIAEIEKHKPLVVAFDGTCTKQAKKTINKLPKGTEMIYVAGTNQQIDQLKSVEGLKHEPTWEAVFNAMTSSTTASRN